MQKGLWAIGQMGNSGKYYLTFLKGRSGFGQVGDWATLKNRPLPFVKQKGLRAIGQLGNSKKYTSHSYKAKGVFGRLGNFGKYNSPFCCAGGALGDWAIGQL